MPIRIQDGRPSLRPGAPGEPKPGLRRRTLRYVEQEQAEGQRRYTLEDESASDGEGILACQTRITEICASQFP